MAYRKNDPRNEEIESIVLPEKICGFIEQKKIFTRGGRPGLLFKAPDVTCIVSSSVRASNGNDLFCAVASLKLPDGERKYVTHCPTAKFAVFVVVQVICRIQILKALGAGGFIVGQATGMAIMPDPWHDTKSFDTLRNASLWCSPTETIVARFQLDILQIPDAYDCPDAGVMHAPAEPFPMSCTLGLGSHQLNIGLKPDGSDTVKQISDAIVTCIEHNAETWNRRLALMRKKFETPAQAPQGRKLE